jgi:hypothetical protein
MPFSNRDAHQIGGLRVNTDHKTRLAAFTAFGLGKPDAVVLPKGGAAMRASAMPPTLAATIARPAHFPKYFYRKNLGRAALSIMT